MCEILNAFHALVESKRIYSKDLKVWDLVLTKPVVFFAPLFARTRVFRFVRTLSAPGMRVQTKAKQKKRASPRKNSLYNRP